MAAIVQPSSSSSNRSMLGAALFREIHKNTWLKRLTAEGKKVTVGPKKSERSWVVFCVHDDAEALLEGYAEPRQAASHNPEWVVSMQNTLHISHALIPNSNEFEFVVTLSNEVIRFHALSWETMQEWVETLRSKLREMKILSPRENLYTKLPEARPTLLPTRDPTSPLPLPPPVPAAIVPGVEIVLPPSLLQATVSQQQITHSSQNITTTTTTSPITTTATVITTLTTETQTLNIPAMSNTSTQNFLNLLSDPISSYSEQLQASEITSSSNYSTHTLHNSEQLSSSLSDLYLNESISYEVEAGLSPLLRPASTINNAENKRYSADQVKNVDEQLMQCERLIPRLNTSRSQSAGAADKNKKSRQNAKTLLDSNITALEITTTPETPIPSTSNETKLAEICDEEENTKTNITIIQVSSSIIEPPLQQIKEKVESPKTPVLPLKNTTTSSAEIFKFPDLQESDVTINAEPITKLKTQKHSEYKSNVQLIPSNGNVNSSTIKILGETATSLNSASTSNQYSTAIRKKIISQNMMTSVTKPETNQITTVHVGGDLAQIASVSVYGSCFTPSPPTKSSPLSTPKLPKKIILSANTSGITNITVDNDANRSQTKNQENLVRCNVGNVHYEKVFLSSSTPIVAAMNTTSITPTTTTTTILTSTNITQIKNSPKQRNYGNSIQNGYEVDISNGSKTNVEPIVAIEQTSPTTTNTIESQQQIKKKNKNSKAVQTTTTNIVDTNQASPMINTEGSPSLLPRRSIAFRPTNMLTRGLTEAVITTRPSRRDLHFASSSSYSKSHNTPTHSAVGGKQLSSKSAINNNENGDRLSPSNATDMLEQQRRSSSTSDATRTQRNTRNANNNEVSNRPIAALRFQQPPQPFRNVENSLVLGASSLIGVAAAATGGMSPPPVGASVSKRLTLREQQVIQLRREIMHPGGVRLQLRRKDCMGSVAWVEAFGAIWVAGWKQKEHPVLYNALHIGDQLLSIAGVTISSAAEANKIIRNSNTLFVEVLIRRMPFGRGYAIRRDREGQCLGLIRDGNTATIVDVVPNSLAARHGLPPKTQSCDGTSLTFWVLTEINGRPLNLFFKENEIRDRLNSVGRDISIFVQPSDLITKLKKQLKSLRGYKDYLVQ